MKHILFFCISLFICFTVQAQTFIRSELPTKLNTPWEILYGPDSFLWLTESGGKLVRVDPSNGNKTIVYTAPDYFDGSPLENSPLCANLSIGHGTLGLALHPHFTNIDSAFIYFLYSYNSGTNSIPETKFRIKQLKWDATSNTIVNDTNIIDMISTGYDHLGGRLIAVSQNNKSYLYLSIGDNGRSEDSQPECYEPQSTNPNNFTQDVTTQNGKIHRFNIDGTIPFNNPISGNSYFTRGHRNPQGLMYNPNLDIVYAIEHGDSTDDEINVLHKGMNYGWKNVRGYHNDNSYPDEANFVADYVPNPLVSNDSLVEPLFAWCNTPSTSSDWTSWCTVAPSGGIYYGNDAIPQWNNSLLVVTLKDGLSTDREVYQFNLQENGNLVPSTTQNPNPKKFFGADQALNGRLRDIAISNDGQSIYLINNGDGISDKITVYTFDSTSSVNENSALPINVQLYPNPATDILTIKGLDNYPDLIDIIISTPIGNSIQMNYDENYQINISKFAKGVHFIHLIFENRAHTLKFIKI